jgi:hypothetical protein
VAELDEREPDEEEYRVLNDVDFTSEWGIKFERGQVVLTSPALPVAGIPISHTIRLAPATLERWLAHLKGNSTR